VSQQRPQPLDPHFPHAITMPNPVWHEYCTGKLADNLSSRESRPGKAVPRLFLIIFTLSLDIFGGWVYSFSMEENDETSKD